MKQLFLFSFNEFWLNWRGFLLTLFIGLVIGLLVGFFIRFRTLGIFMSVLTACVGSYFCDLWFFPDFKVSKNPMVCEVVACITGALVLSLTINLIFGSNKGRDRTMWRA